MENTLYFAYGSNINLGQMEYRCPDASVVGPVVLEGWELLFRRGGFATIAPKEGEQVQGLLTRVVFGIFRVVALELEHSQRRVVSGAYGTGIDFKRLAVFFQGFVIFLFFV